MSARIVAAGMLALALMRSCAAEGDASGPAGTGIQRSVQFVASWHPGVWMDVTVTIGGDRKGPFEAANGFDRTWQAAPGTSVQFDATPHNEPPPGLTVCRIYIASIRKPIGDSGPRSDGRCSASGVVPKVDTQALGATGGESR